MHPKQTLHVCLGTPKIYAPFALRAKDRNKDKNEATDRFFCDLFAQAKRSFYLGSPFERFRSNGVLIRQVSIVFFTNRITI
ncbi:hypothetical protein ES703_106314 [subsurface metagenome]